MKMNIYFKGLVVSLLLIVGMFTSCEDQPDKFELTGGLPPSELYTYALFGTIGLSHRGGKPEIYYLPCG